MLRAVQTIQLFQLTFSTVEKLTMSFKKYFSKIKKKHAKLGDTYFRFLKKNIYEQAT